MGLLRRRCRAASMRTQTGWCRIAALWVALVAWQVWAHGQAALAPVSYVCPMVEHSDVVEERAGKCPRCGMALVPVRISLAWSCPVHPAVITDTAGRCPLDRRDLVEVAVAVHWTCDGQTQRFDSPGRCSDGRARRIVREHRAHGDHNPRHGGQLFMASNQWHHIEGTMPSPGLVRFFVYDNFTRAMTVQDMSGRVVTREELDSSTRRYRELASVTLKRSRDRGFLEASLGDVRPPARLTLKLQLERSGPEERFDFTFDALSQEPPRAAPASASRAPSRSGGTSASDPSLRPPSPAGAPAPAIPSAPAVAAGGMVSTGPPPAFDPAIPVRALAHEPEAIIRLAQDSVAEVRRLIDQRRFDAIYVPALTAKEAALALEDHSGSIPDEPRVRFRSAIRRIVLASWALDAAGDAGNLEAIETGYRSLADAVNQTAVLYVAP